MLNEVINKDLKYINDNLDEKKFFNGSKILITGCAGFLGYYFINYFIKYKKEIGIKKIIGLDNFILDKPKWLEKLTSQNPNFLEVKKFNIISDDLQVFSDLKNVDYVLHMASIASPVFYRKYPIETLDANVWGLRSLLDFYKNKNLKGFLMFSSSEIYGDPDPNFIPTKESYFGNVSTIGPRACYDEAKRFSETLCYLYSKEYDMPISMVRPFNNYGPGMKLNDQRVPADFAKAIKNAKDIKIFSDGTPTRTFCYISDAIVGYLKALTYKNFEIFNIGIDSPEISIAELAKIYAQKGKLIFKYKGKVRIENPPEKDYMTNNPNRRCPDISLAKKILKFNPQIKVDVGIERFLSFLKNEVQSWSQ